MLTLESLNKMATEQPGEIALNDDSSFITFSQLKRLIDRLSNELFDEEKIVYGQHIQNGLSKNIIALCAEQTDLNSVINIPAIVSQQELSFSLKANNINVLYTDIMDKVRDTARTLGPLISLISPVEVFHDKVWKVKFREDRGGTQIDDEEIRFHYNQLQHSQTVPHQLPNP